MGIGHRLLKYFSRTSMLSDRRRLHWYPPFLMMRIKVVELADDWTRLRIRLPLNTFSVNPGGVMFGGYQAALADPIPAMACARRFSNYSIWTRALEVDFVHAGNSDLELRFEISENQLKEIAEQLEKDGRANPTFEYGFYRTDGLICTQVRNTVAIRARGYQKNAE